MAIIGSILDGGLIHTHNASAAPETKVNVYDRLLKVNGAECTKAQVASALGSSGKCELTFQRPREKLAIIHAKDTTLGLALQSNAESNAIYLTSVSESPAHKDIGVDFQASDRIISVNGVTGSSQTLLTTMRAAAVIELCVLTYVGYKLRESIRVLKMQPPSSGSWGLDFDPNDTKSAVITKVRPGSHVDSCNKAAPSANEKVLPCDRLLKVNGQTGTREELTKMMAEVSGEAEFTFQRPVTKRTVFSRSSKSESLGLGLKSDGTTPSVLVESVLEGAAKAGGATFEVGDRIVAVNGLSGNVSGPLKLTMALQDSVQLDLCVKSYPAVDA
eukprot:TRINITY_DN8375_c1_g1_i1.p1 TRINITY_DN8375_c1_g1~~TRINITY_DN8375_c1_g1_i1.p1  ORF type:complete len:330 (-),score=53.07 TRINITY_DN8375_c1_g1_i1:71-1060(-)